ncbi:MAG: sugar ABC transporter ATP-binding protein [Planctomycetota bacterium]|nr:sugar ABC transporter ATP-binding protein [Planctomycetota bacterium]
MPLDLLCVRGISKRFVGVQALADVDLTLARGEVLAVIGENGAGKSTLMKILAGLQSPDRGTLEVDGAPATLANPRAAAAAGIALIHQELCLATNLDVDANVFLGREPNRGGRIDRATIRARSTEILQRIGATFAADAPTASLSVGQQQQVEIAKALAVDARVLIMDEPTSSLSARETADLFRIVRELRASGVSVVYISHRLSEVIELADRVSVLRDGRNAGELAREEITHDAMVRLMVGRDVSLSERVSARRAGAAVLKVEGLRTSAWPAESVDLEVYPGEIVGVAGLVGSGRTELLRAIFGVEAAVAGTVAVEGAQLPGDVVRSVAAGLGLVPEDRKGLGLFTEWTVPWNVSLANLAEVATRGRIDRGAEAELAARFGDQLTVKAGAGQVAGMLSGGNQQKVVLAKWLATGPKVLLLDEPTRGIDVGARQEIYQLLEKLARAGLAILFVSSEMEEVLALPDRVLVMHEGRLAGQLDRSELSEQAVMTLATGGSGAAA